MALVWNLSEELGLANRLKARSYSCRVKGKTCNQALNESSKNLLLRDRMETSKNSFFDADFCLRTALL